MVDSDLEDSAHSDNSDELDDSSSYEDDDNSDDSMSEYLYDIGVKLRMTIPNSIS